MIVDILQIKFPENEPALPNLDKNSPLPFPSQFSGTLFVILKSFCEIKREWSRFFLDSVESDSDLLVWLSNLQF
jgi:hypothetical protein